MGKVQEKYRKALTELENDVMKVNFKDIDLSSFFSSRGLDKRLISVFIKNKVFKRIGNSSLYTIEKPHEVQRLARNPDAALQLIREHKLASAWKTNDSKTRLLIEQETDKEIPSDHEIGVITADLVKPEENIVATKTYGEEVVRRADKEIEKDLSEMSKSFNRLFRGIQYNKQSNIRLTINGVESAFFNTEHLPERVEEVIKKDVYPKYLERAKETLDKEFEEFRRWKEAQGEQN